MNKWIEEVQEKHSVALKFEIKEHLFSGESEFQKVDVVETVQHGRMLLNDGFVMLSERDEFVYHDMITHVPLFVHPSPRRVLVIGGGDGGTAREVLRHKNVEFCRMVEIDEMVVEACREHIPQTACGMEPNERFELNIDDGVKFVAETDEKFDVVLVDSTDPIGPAQPLFGPEFYSGVHRILNEDGIVVAQGESPFYEPDTQASMLKVVGEFFPKVSLYNFNNMTYPGGLWSFLFASKKYHPLRDLDPKRVENSGLHCRWYNVDIHRAAFAQPQFMRDKFAGLLKDQ